MIRYSIAFGNIGLGADLSFRSTKTAIKFFLWGLMNGKKPRIRVYFAKYRRAK